jgi:16S rRNA (guanine527-N7)-methyltransferase
MGLKLRLCLDELLWLGHTVPKLMNISYDIDQFTLTLRREMSRYGVELGTEIQQNLRNYYALLSQWNTRLHLVAPCSGEEFARRHALESLLMLSRLPDKARIADVGSGGGLPIIPCLLTRSDLAATLIESSQKKAVFLQEAVNRLGIGARATIIARRFEDTPPPKVNFISSRALEHFTRELESLIDWSPKDSTLLLYGGNALRDRLEKLGAQFTEDLIPQSEKRFLFVVTRP